MRKIMPPLWLLIATVLMTVLHFVLPVKMLIRFPFNLSGMVLVITALLLFVCSVKKIRQAKTTIRPFQESSTLITTGPFSICRNPIYLSMSLLLTGFAILFGSLTPLLVVPVFILLIDRIFILGEQHILQTTFGDEYTQYCRRVRRWI